MGELHPAPLALSRVLFSSSLQLQPSLNHTLELQEGKEDGKETGEAAGSQDRSLPLQDSCSAQDWCSRAGLRVKALYKAAGQSQIPARFQSSPETCGASMSTKQLPSSSWTLSLHPVEAPLPRGSFLSRAWGWQKV